MRVDFKHPGQARRFLKLCKQILEDGLTAPDGERLPTQRVRNAFCRGIGYSHYDELKRTMERRNRVYTRPPAEDDLLRAVTKGFSLAFAVVEGYRFSLPEPADTLVPRLAEEFVRGWSWESAAKADDHIKP